MRLSTLTQFSCLLRLVCLAALLLACLPGCTTLGLVEKPITITFAFPSYDLAYYQRLLPAFKKQAANITVELHPIQSAPGQIDFKRDVFVFNWEVSANAQDQVVKAAKPLDMLLEQDRSFNVADFYPNTLDAFKQNGKLYAIPAGLDPWVMYYNRDLFDQYGVPYPQLGWTWDDFLQKAAAISHPDEAIYGYTTRPGYYDSFFFLGQHGGRLVDSNGQPTFNDPLNVEAMLWYSRLFNDLNLAPTPAQAATAYGYANDSSLLGILKGKIGMWNGTLSDRGGMNQDLVKWNIRWGVAPLPREAQAFTGIFFEGYAISNESANPDAAWQWIAFLSQQIPNRLMPARRSLVESASFANQAGKEVAEAGRASLENAILVTPEALRQLGPAIGLFFDAVRQIVEQHTPPAIALDGAQKQAQK
jgi:ABC-type glycerol-3-phosphate transport system substrate-binding protein